MIVAREVTDTLAFYLEELERGETDARDAQARLLDALDRMDFVIVHRESIRFRDDQS